MAVALLIEVRPCSTITLFHSGYCLRFIVYGQLLRDGRVDALNQLPTVVVWLAIFRIEGLGFRSSD